MRVMIFSSLSLAFAGLLTACGSGTGGDSKVEVVSVTPSASIMVSPSATSVDQTVASDCSALNDAIETWLRDGGTADAVKSLSEESDAAVEAITQNNWDTVANIMKRNIPRAVKKIPPKPKVDSAAITSCQDEATISRWMGVKNTEALRQELARRIDPSGDYGDFAEFFEAFDRFQDFMSPPKTPEVRDYVRYLADKWEPDFANFQGQADRAYRQIEGS
jgi:hypothetical protein